MGSTTPLNQDSKLAIGDLVTPYHRMTQVRLDSDRLDEIFNPGTNYVITTQSLEFFQTNVLFFQKVES